MKILALSVRQPGVSFEDIQSLQVEEVTEVWRLQQEGILREVYFDPERPAAILILEADSHESARDALARLPMKRAGMIDFDLFTLGPFSQLQVLFGKEAQRALHD